GPKVDLDPAIGTIAHPACPRTVESIIYIGSTMDLSITRHGVFGHCWASFPISREGQVLAVIRLLGKTQRWHIAIFANDDLRRGSGCCQNSLYERNIILRED